MYTAAESPAGPAPTITHSQGAGRARAMSHYVDPASFACAMLAVFVALQVAPMTPRWLTIEKLVAELGGVCSARHEVHGPARVEAISEDDAEAAVVRATTAVTAAIADPLVDDDAVVRQAWTEIARAQDAIGRLRQTIQRSRQLRDRAQQIQDQSLRRRLARAGSQSPSPPPARRGTRRD